MYVREVQIKILIPVFLVTLPSLSESFPDGAPIDACVKPRKNEPHHGAATAQTGPSPYALIASSDRYYPGSQISVRIQGIRGTPFRGFFLQARDADTGEWVGQWETLDNTSELPECSSITHADNRDKLQANLIWNSPAEGSGRVYFTGSVVKDFATFWVNLIADVSHTNNKKK